MLLLYHTRIACKQRANSKKNMKLSNCNSVQRENQKEVSGYSVSQIKEPQCENRSNKCNFHKWSLNRNSQQWTYAF